MLAQIPQLRPHAGARGARGRGQVTALQEPPARSPQARAGPLPTSPRPCHPPCPPYGNPGNKRRAEGRLAKESLLASTLRS